MNEISNQIIKQQENTIVRAVQEVGIEINKEQLTKALTDAKSFYDTGYDEGYTKGYLEAMKTSIKALHTMFIAEGGNIEDLIEE